MSLWLHGMSENKVFSSNTPQFTALLVMCVSGRQDLICAPFESLVSELPEGIGGDADAFFDRLRVIESIAK